MHENTVYLSTSEDLAQLQMEKGTLKYHREACSHQSGRVGRYSRSIRQLILLEETSIVRQLLFAWLTTFGVLITTRNFSPTGLEDWASKFPVCDPTDWRSTPPHHWRFSFHDRSCEYQIVQLALLQVLFWIKIIRLLWHTSFGQRHLMWVFIATAAGTYLTMILINDMASAFLLAMPVILSTVASISYVLDAT
ncbi:hypothetical protein CGRA01v4_09371 [Colletotrichum graminicola]|nr:hypothetical protein CGRA01v4_09371 [Colletotrichum graminicola]